MLVFLLIGIGLELDAKMNEAIISSGSEVNIINKLNSCGTTIKSSTDCWPVSSLAAKGDLIWSDIHIIKMQLHKSW